MYRPGIFALPLLARWQQVSLPLRIAPPHSSHFSPDMLSFSISPPDSISDHPSTTSLSALLPPPARLLPRVDLQLTLGRAQDSYIQVLLLPSSAFLSNTQSCFHVPLSLPTSSQAQPSPRPHPSHPPPVSNKHPPRPDRRTTSTRARGTLPTSSPSTRSQNPSPRSRRTAHRPINGRELRARYSLTPSSRRVVRPDFHISIAIRSF